MEEAVDKEEEAEATCAHAVHGRLFPSDLFADDDLAVLGPRPVGEDVRHVILAAQLLIEAPRERLRGVRKRNLPAGEDGLGGFLIAGRHYL
jgi:hypothetical protein